MVAKKTARPDNSKTHYQLKRKITAFNDLNKIQFMKQLLQ